MTSDIRKATAEDVAFFYGLDSMPRASIRAMVVEIDGMVQAIGGVSFTIGGPVAFMSMKPGAEKHPKAIMKAAKEIKKHIYSQFRSPIYAVRDTGIESSDRFLRRFGFLPIENSEVYQWLPQSHS